MHVYTHVYIYIYIYIYTQHTSRYEISDNNTEFAHLVRQGKSERPPSAQGPSFETIICATDASQAEGIVQTSDCGGLDGFV